MSGQVGVGAQPPRPLAACTVLPASPSERMMTAEGLFDEDNRFLFCEPYMEQKYVQKTRRVSRARGRQ